MTGGAGALGDQGVHGGSGAVPDLDRVPGGEESAGHLPAHGAQSDESDLHGGGPLFAVTVWSIVIVLRGAVAGRHPAPDGGAGRAGGGGKPWCGAAGWSGGWRYG
ncbi:hypothetical protein GCM10010441_35870 [Kitasatospora paracochleata]